MSNTTDPRYNTGDSLRDVFRFLCDASFAVWPKDVAHSIGEFEKNLWGGVRWFADKNIEWIDEALSGGDRLRAEWQRRRSGVDASTPAAEGNGT